MGNYNKQDYDNETDYCSCCSMAKSMCLNANSELSSQRSGYTQRTQSLEYLV